MTPAARPEDTVIADLARRWREGRRIRRRLDGGGVLHIERQLPFLVVHRGEADGSDDACGALITATASWLQAPGERRQHRRVRSLVSRWARDTGEAFGAALVVEVWAGPVVKPGESVDDVDPGAPAFRVLAPRRGPSDRTVRSLAEALGRLRVRRSAATVSVEYTARRRPADMPALVGKAEAAAGCTVIGLEVRPVHLDPETGEVFPLVLRTLRRRLSAALHKAVFTFAHSQTTHRPAHYHELGRGVLSRTAREVDGRLAALGSSFDFLLACTPVDSEVAWERFRRSGRAELPTFHYRPLRVDPVRLKRELYDLPLEKVEDPALATLFRGQQAEIDRQLTLLLDRQTPQFLPGAVALYGPVEPELKRLARRVLKALPPRGSRSQRGTVDAQGFAAAAERELAALRRQWPEMPGDVTVRADLYSGLMVSHGRLLVGAGLRVPASRVDALIQHEVGTHMLTFANGGSQPFRQLAIGLDGYDALQEGLAVLSEHLVGGLSAARLRLLAVRVLAADSVVRGADFLETFALVAGEGLDEKTAFGVTMRVHRAGGLPKDAVYLRGLKQVLDLLARGADPAELYVGKIAADHIGTVRELTRRRILRPAPLRPTWLDDPVARQRLEVVRRGVTLLNLAKEAR